ncbi:MAG: TrmH family RNA methyltransferase [Proteobacteria bacterium]|nr:TrmH family RNA methyltransferase [Pseudomonadota bacterium]
MQDNVQLTHKEHESSDNKFPLSIIANDITDPLNVGSLFRLSDALGIEKLYLCGGTPIPPNTKIKKTSRSTEKYVIFEQYNNAVELVATLKKSDAFIISLEITSSSIPIDSAEFTNKIKKEITNKKPIYLILGSENSGVSENLLALSDLTTHITMHGNNSSMNVISAVSIACFEITRNMATIKYFI